LRLRLFATFALKKAQVLIDFNTKNTKRRRRKVFMYKRMKKISYQNLPYWEFLYIFETLKM